MHIILKDLVTFSGGEIKGDPKILITGAASFESAKKGDITYASNNRYINSIEATGASAVIVPAFIENTSKGLIVSENPRLSFAKVLSFFYPRKRPEPKIESNAYIGKNFACGNAPYIGAFAYIGDDVSIGDNVTVHGGAVISDQTVIGDDTEIFPNVSILKRCSIGSQVIIQAGTVIGSDGFGFVQDSSQKHIKIEHIGKVTIEDDVEIGACCAIDRAVFGETKICSGVKIDNHVHIGHNVKIGENSLIVAGVSIGGSVVIGKNVIVAGQAGIAQHITIGDGAILGPRSGVVKNVADGQIVSGYTEMPHRTWLKVQNIIPRLPEIVKKIAGLEKRIEIISKEGRQK